MYHPLRGRRDESGALSAEAAMALPTLVVITVALAWIVSFGVTQVRVVDAAREAARAAARADTTVDADALARRVAPPGAQVRVRTGPDTVVARVTATVRGPGGVFARLGPVRVSAEAVAAAEPTW